MAYVAISQALINETEQNITRMKDRERNQLPSPANEMKVNHDNSIATNIVWGEYAHLKNVLPEDWTQCVDSIHVNITYNFRDAPKDTTFIIRSNDKQFLVPHLRSNGYNSTTIKVYEDHPFVQQFASALVEHRRATDELNVKWNGIKEQVVTFLKAAKSLNEALKLWPALALYISDSYINRVNEKTSRGATVSRAAEILAQMQTDNITAAAVSAKLS